MGEARLPSEGCAVPAGSDSPGQSCREFERISAGAGGVATQLHETAVEKHSLQPGGNRSVFGTDGVGDWNGNLSDHPPANKLGRSDQARTRGRDSADVHATPSLAARPHEL